MIIKIIQTVIGVLIIVLILLQERSTGLSAIFGGEGGFYRARRGLEKFIFVGTIILTIIFVGLTIFSLLK